jgi:hypothetical protein
LCCTLCTLCYQFLLIVLFYCPLWYSLTFICDNVFSNVFVIYGYGLDCIYRILKTLRGHENYAWAFTLTSRPYPYVTKTLKLQCHNDLHKRYSDIRYQNVIITFEVLRYYVFRIRYMQDVVTTYFLTFLLRANMVLMLT